jgi:hypothetical protein
MESACAEQKTPLASLPAGRSKLSRNHIIYYVPKDNIGNEKFDMVRLANAHFG